jgi:hypothetical protein
MIQGQTGLNATHFAKRRFLQEGSMEGRPRLWITRPKNRGLEDHSNESYDLPLRVLFIPPVFSLSVMDIMPRGKGACLCSWHRLCVVSHIGIEL